MLFQEIFALIQAGHLTQAREKLSLVAGSAVDSVHLDALEAYFEVKSGECSTALPRILAFEAANPGDLSALLMLLDYAAAAGLAGLVAPLCRGFERRFGVTLGSLARVPNPRPPTVLKTELRDLRDRLVASGAGAASDVSAAVPLLCEAGMEDQALALIQSLPLQQREDVTNRWLLNVLMQSVKPNEGTDAEIIRAVTPLARDYLSKRGWFESVRTRQAVDLSGPVPWLTYPALRLLEQIVRPEWKVLEYGSGNSSRWWSRRVDRVVSVEHDVGWARSVSGSRISNLTVIERVANHSPDEHHRRIIMDEFFDSGQPAALAASQVGQSGLSEFNYLGYAAAALEYPSGFFDVIVVDGMARILTAWIAARQLREGGLIVFDNSDRAEYTEGYEFLAKNGFVRIDFWGPGPINPYEWCTSIFTKNLGALGPRPAASFPILGK